MQHDQLKNPHNSNWHIRVHFWQACAMLEMLTSSCSVRRDLSNDMYHVMPFWIFNEIRRTAISPYPAMLRRNWLCHHALLKETFRVICVSWRQFEYLWDTKNGNISLFCDATEMLMTSSYFARRNLPNDMCHMTSFRKFNEIRKTTISPYPLMLPINQSRDHVQLDESFRIMFDTWPLSWIFNEIGKTVISPYPLMLPKNLSKIWIFNELRKTLISPFRFMLPKNWSRDLTQLISYLWLVYLPGLISCIWPKKLSIEMWFSVQYSVKRTKERV